MFGVIISKFMCGWKDVRCTIHAEGLCCRRKSDVVEWVEKKISIEGAVALTCGSSFVNGTTVSA